MPESVTIIDEQPDVVVVRATCPTFDEDSVHQFRNEVSAAALQAPSKPFVLDLSAVTFLPSMSLAALIRVSAEFRDRQQRLMVAGLQRPVREIFVITRLDRMFDLQDDTAAAIGSLRPR